MINKQCYVFFKKRTGDYVASFVDHLDAEKYLELNKDKVNEPYYFDVEIARMDIIMQARENLELKPVKLK